MNSYFYMMELHGKLSTIDPEENLNDMTNHPMCFEMIDTKPGLKLMVAPEEVGGTLKSEFILLAS